MIKWISLLFDRSKKEAEALELKNPEPKIDLKKLTKGDLKKLYAQGKIKEKPC